ncbi:MAG: Precorrin-4 C(11)-methyltransferase, partial [uncultured Solirubrobacteraceae bacterium]
EGPLRRSRARRSRSAHGARPAPDLLVAGVPVRRRARAAGDPRTGAARRAPGRHAAPGPRRDRRRIRRRPRRRSRRRPAAFGRSLHLQRGRGADPPPRRAGNRLGAHAWSPGLRGGRRCPALRADRAGSGPDGHPHALRAPGLGDSHRRGPRRPRRSRRDAGGAPRNAGDRGDRRRGHAALRARLPGRGGGAGELARRTRPERHAGQHRRARPRRRDPPDGDDTRRPGSGSRRIPGQSPLLRRARSPLRGL